MMKHTSYLPLNKLHGQSSDRATVQKGSIAIWTALMMPIMLVTAGLAIDVGKFFIVKSELQNAADACALAAAYELDGATAVSFTNAQSAGVSLASANSVLFQSNVVNAPIVEFSNAIDGGYVTATAANPATDVYARCRVNEPDIPNWFLSLLPSFGEQTINAQAVASNVPGQQTCALPIGICDTAAPPGTPVGTWVGGVQSAQNGTGGYFQWIDFNPPAGGANELKALLSGANSCQVSATSPTIGQFGVASGAEPHYNTRFGIYSGGTPSGAAPDYSGHAYHLSNWPSKFNAYSDYISNQVASHSAYQNPLAGINLSGNPSVLSAGELATRGQNRRIAVAPVISCATQTIQRWACVFLLHPMNTQGNPSFEMYLEYLGDASTNSPCKTFDLPGGPGTIGPRVSALVQ